MSVSVRSNNIGTYNLGGTRGATLSTSRHSTGGAVLRSTAAQNIMAAPSRHSNTETKFNPGRRTSSHVEGKGNTAVITIDELQRIRA